MDQYYVNDHAQPTGEHEVHKQGCSFMPHPTNRTYLGWHSNCQQAVNKAREIYRNVDGCYYCTSCHTR